MYFEYSEGKNYAREIQTIPPSHLELTADKSRVSALASSVVAALSRFVADLTEKDATQSHLQNRSIKTAPDSGSRRATSFTHPADGRC